MCCASYLNTTSTHVNMPECHLFQRALALISNKSCRQGVTEEVISSRLEQGLSPVFESGYLREKALARNSEKS